MNSKIIFALLVLGCLSYSEAVKCYNCVACNGIGKLIDCAAGGLRNNKCWKVTAADGTVVRSCSDPSRLTVKDGCSKTSTGATICQCNGDRCNSATSLSISTALVLLPALVSKVLSF